MNARVAIAALLLGVACTREPRDEEATERLRTPSPKPHVAETLPCGAWEAVDCPEWAWLKIMPTGVPGEYRVRRSRLHSDDPTPVNIFAGATWVSEVLVLDSPLFGQTSWRLHRSAQEHWLVPDARISAEEGDIPVTEEMRFRLVSPIARADARNGELELLEGF